MSFVKNTFKVHGGNLGIIDEDKEMLTLVAVNLWKCWDPIGPGGTCETSAIGFLLYWPLFRYHYI